jgi:hypothetical protein
MKGTLEDTLKHNLEDIPGGHLEETFEDNLEEFI